MTTPVNPMEQMIQNAMKEAIREVVKEEIRAALTEYGFSSLELNTANEE